MITSDSQAICTGDQRGDCIQFVCRAIHAGDFVSARRQTQFFAYAIIKAFDFAMRVEFGDMERGS